jgi:radical SAM superfamily enzyme YgiQ (UPF0313 family)
MRVLFISNILTDFIGHEPMGIMYLSSSLKMRGHQSAIVSSDERDILAAYRRFQPHVLAYSTTTGFHQFYIDLNRRIRSQVKSLSVFGGPHATFFPEMIEMEGVDAICMGEGEVAFGDFLDRLSRGEDISTVQNFWVKKNGEVRRNDLRPLLENLDELPFPDRQLIDSHPASRRSQMRGIMTMRGCPYQCSYCFNHSYLKLYKGKGSILRRRSVENALAEVEEVVSRYRPQIVRFIDDTFILFPEWVENFCREYRKRFQRPFKCNVRANLVTPEVVRWLKEAGCISVAIGLEAGNDHIRNDVLKRNMSREQILRACRLLKEAKIRFYTENIIGIPGETFPMALETFRLNAECRPDFAEVSLCQPYPRTELGDYAQSLGIFDGDIEKIKPSYNRSSIFRMEDCRRVENLHKLMGLGIQFPWSLPLIRVLVRLPFPKLYLQLYKLWKGYCGRYRIYPQKLSLGEFWEIFRRYMGREGYH